MAVPENDKVLRYRASRGAIGALLIVATLTVLAGGSISAQESAIPPAGWDGSRVYFPDTGQALGGAFLRSWALDYQEFELGAPVTPAIEVDGRLTQWTEFGRLEFKGQDIESVARSNVVRAPIGHEYAEKMGYKRWVSAFKPIAAGTQSRYFYETRHSLSNEFLIAFEQPGIEERLGAPISEEFNIGEVAYQFFEYGALSWDATNGTQFVPLGHLDASLSGFGNMPDDQLPDDVTYSSASMLAMSDAFPGERWIEIDLTNHELIAWVGDVELMRTKVVTGPPEAPTPTGTHEIYIKHEVQNLSGIGWNGQPYSSPGTPWVMYFFEDYGIHGSTWRDEYGFGDGQGCVIPPNEEAEQLWKWADYGTRVWVHD